MAILDILNYPDPRLHTVAKPVKEVTAEVKRLLDDMAETMYSAPGIGLAATQVNQHLQIIIIDTSEAKDSLRVFINPKIIDKSGEQDYEEGCLSVPGIYENVTRAAKVKVEHIHFMHRQAVFPLPGSESFCQISVNFNHMQVFDVLQYP